MVSEARHNRADPPREISMTTFSKGKRRGLGVVGGRLADCPYSPNCVCSDAADPARRIGPFALAIEPSAAWNEIRAAVAALPRTRIVKRTSDYLHAECHSALFGFVDDLELYLRTTPGGGVAVRSAARIGHWDFGVNRARVEQLRSDLVKRGVIAP
jgi:uncharacterized protein (DUF1499 family)